MVIELIYAGYKTGTVRAAWKDRKQWERIRANGMRQSFGWEASAKRYVEVYAQAQARAAAGGA